VKAVTVKQPWAWAISTGKKTVENRSRNTTHRGRVAIHAGLSWSQRGAGDERIIELAATYGRIPALAILGGYVPFGAIIATAEIVDAHPEAGCCRPWGESAYDGKPVWHWVLESISALDVPVPCRGMLGLWAVPDDIAAAIGGEQ
jgi:hypothetical protein